MDPDDPDVPLTDTQLTSLARYGLTGDHLKGNTMVDQRCDSGFAKSHLPAVNASTDERKHDG